MVAVVVVVGVCLFAVDISGIRAFFYNLPYACVYANAAPARSCPSV